MATVLSPTARFTSVRSATAPLRTSACRAARRPSGPNSSPIFFSGAGPPRSRPAISASSGPGAVRLAAQLVGVAQFQLQPGREHGAHAVVNGAEVFFAHPLRKRQHFGAEQVAVRRGAYNLLERPAVAAFFGCAEDDSLPALSAAAEGYGDARAGHGPVPEPVRHEIVKAALREVGEPFHRDLCDQCQSS